MFRPEVATEPHAILPYQKFVSDVERLYSKEFSTSVKVLSSVFVLPVALLAISDFGRFVARTVGLIRGNEYSLLTKSCQLCHKVAAYFTPTLEQKVENEARALIHGYRERAGSNSFFAGADLIKGANEIEKSEGRLVALAKEFNDIEMAKAFIQNAIVKAAKGDYFAAYNEQEVLPRVALAEVAYKRFIDALNPAAMIRNLIRNGQVEEGIEALVRQVEQGIITQAEAKKTVFVAAKQVYRDAFQQTDGIQAEKSFDAILEKAKGKFGLFSWKWLASQGAKIVAAKLPEASTEIEEKKAITEVTDKYHRKNLLPSIRLCDFTQRIQKLLPQARRDVARQVAEIHQKEEIRVSAEAKLQQDAQTAEEIIQKIQDGGRQLQAQIEERVTQYQALIAKHQELDRDVRLLREARAEHAFIMLDGQKLSVTAALDGYNRKIEAVTESHKSYTKRNELLKQFAGESFDILQKLNETNRQIQTKVEEAAKIEGQLKEEYAILKSLFATYGRYMKQQHAAPLSEELVSTWDLCKKAHKEALNITRFEEAVQEIRERVSTSPKPSEPAAPPVVEEASVALVVEEIKEPAIVAAPVVEATPETPVEPVVEATPKTPVEPSAPTRARSLWTRAYDYALDHSRIAL